MQAKARAVKSFNREPYRSPSEGGRSPSGQGRAPSNGSRERRDDHSKNEQGRTRDKPSLGRPTSRDRASRPTGAAGQDDGASQDESWEAPRGIASLQRSAAAAGRDGYRISEGPSLMSHHAAHAVMTPGNYRHSASDRVRRWRQSVSHPFWKE